MSEPEEDQPITEEDFARMLAEQDAQDQAPEEAAADPEPEPEAEVELQPGDLVVDLETGESTTVPEEPGEPPAEELEVDAETELAEHVAWAQRRNLSDFEAATKLAYEQEKFLGRKSSEIEALREQLREYEEQQPQQTPEGRSDQWIAAALSSPDPGRYAWELAQGGDWTTYQQFMGMWETIVGETVTMGVHQQILAGLEEQAAQEPEQPVQPNAIADAFAAVGVYDLQNDPLAPTIRAVADEMGGQHPLVVAAGRGDQTAIAAIVEIARSRTYTTRTVRLDGTPVDDESRKRAAAITGEGGAPVRTPPAKDPLAEDREAWRRMGVLPVE
jgi:hypothetical protein